MMPRENNSPVIQNFAPNSAPEGARIVITGKKLTGASRVTIKGRPTSFTANSAKQITVTVPDGVEKGKIEITTPSGKSVSSSDFIPMRFPLTLETNEKFRHQSYQCHNLSLLLDRYIGYQDGWQFKEEQKAALLKTIQAEFRFDERLVQHNYARWQAIAQSLPHTQTFTASPEWRMVVGLGQTSILETSMVLDRTTGIPIIPGSALKGLAASYALLCILEKTDRDKDVEQEYQRFLKRDIPELPLHFEAFIKIFGYQGGVGRVIFLDAVPTKPPKLEPDIMNNHHQEYYGDNTGNTPPAPWDNPIPVYFLTLGRESEFAFAVAGRDVSEETQNLVNKAVEWLKHGLSELGIGAKTAAGYGYILVE